MARLRSRKSTAAKPKIPALLTPLRRRFSTKIPTHLHGTKSEYAGYGLLPEEIPFVKSASTSIFSFGKMQFYVPLAAFPLAKKAVMFCAQTLKNIQWESGSDWSHLVLMTDVVNYDKGVVPCSIEFRSSSSDSVIRLALTVERLVISLPHPCKWGQSGLGWLLPKTMPTSSYCH